MSEERKEIVVSPPKGKPREEPLTTDTTGVEALDVSKASMRIGKYLSSVIVGIGVLLSLFSVYSIMFLAEFPFFSPFVGFLGFLGAMNIFCGLILLTKE